MRLVIGISGASGVWLGYKLLQILKSYTDIETHLVITEGAIKNFALETTLGSTYCKWIIYYRWNGNCPLQHENFSRYRPWLC